MKETRFINVPPTDGVPVVCPKCSIMVLKGKIKIHLEQFCGKKKLILTKDGVKEVPVDFGSVYTWPV